MTYHLFHHLVRLSIEDQIGAWNARGEPVHARLGCAQTGYRLYIHERQISQQSADTIIISAGRKRFVAECLRFVICVFHRRSLARITSISVLGRAPRALGRGRKRGAIVEQQVYNVLPSLIEA